MSDREAPRAFHVMAKLTGAAMRTITDLLKKGRYACEIMDIMAGRDAALRKAFSRAGSNDPCPCGSGRKCKQCHGG